MYIHLGNGLAVKREDVVGIFDLDNSSQSHITRGFLGRAEKEGRVVNVAELELPKSFAVMKDGRVYICQVNSSTLLKRFDSGRLE